MWRRRRALALAALMLIQLAPAIESGTQRPEDVTGEPLVGDVTWENGFYNRTAGVLITPGATLRILNATVAFQSGPREHYGIIVQPGGTLIVRDSTIEHAEHWRSHFERAEKYWQFLVQGVLDMERAQVRHSGDIGFQWDTIGGSRIVDTEFSWTARGMHILRTNLTGDKAWDLELENVTIRDIPSIKGAGLTDIGGGIGILNANVRMKGVTVQNVRAMGLFVDSSAVAQELNSFGNTVEAQDLAIIGGSPDGFNDEGAMVEIANIGSFVCDRCTFVPKTATSLSFRFGNETILSNSTIVNNRVYVEQRAENRLLFDNVTLHGPHSFFSYDYSTRESAEFRNVAFLGTNGAPGAYSTSAQALDMRGVYWGDATGPRDEDPSEGSTPAQHLGGGRTVYGKIDYRDWAVAPHAPGTELVVRLDPIPERMPAGTTGRIPVTITNHGAAARDVDLSTYGPIDATVTPAHVTVGPGETAQATFEFAVAPTVAAGTVIHETILARAADMQVSTAFASLVTISTPTLAIDDPLPFASVVGALDVSGRVLEPEALPDLGGDATPATSGLETSAVGPSDADGDRIDDRIQDVPGLVVVHILHDGARADAIRERVAALGGDVLREFTVAPVVWAILQSDDLPEIAAMTGVQGIFWDEPLEQELALNVRATRARSSQEGVLPGGDAPDADYAGVWSGNPGSGHSGPTGRGLLMAIIDSGIDPTHVALDDLDDSPATVNPKVVGRVSTFAVLAGKPIGLAPDGVVTPGYHGTWVAGTAAGTGQSFLGAPGIAQSTPEDPWLHQGVAPGARLLDVDAFEEVRPAGVDTGLPSIVSPPSGFGLALEGFEAIANWNRLHPRDPVRIAQISLSTGMGGPSHPMNLAANALAESGVLVVVAAGNNHGGVIMPASASKVLAVGALDTHDTVDRADDSRARFSDFSNPLQIESGVHKPELMAPGVDLLMPELGTVNAYGPKPRSGTSFAAPMVSGVAALVWEANPDLHAAQVKEILIRSSEPRDAGFGGRYTDVNLDFEDDLDDGGWDARWGYGLLDAEEAVRLALTTTPRLPPVDPTLRLYLTPTGAQEEPPELSLPLPQESWTHVAGASVVLGDGDAATRDEALVTIAAPTADPSRSVSNATIRLYVGDVLVAQTYYNDNWATDQTDNETLVPVPLGVVSAYDEAGPRKGITRVLEELPVLDARGGIPLAEGQTLRVDVALQHGAAPAPKLSGPAGTRVEIPLDRLSLPNTQGPSRVSGLAATWSATSVDLEWGPAGDDHGVGYYEVLRDGVVVGTVGGTVQRFTDSGLTPGATHTYQVRATDLHGVVGPLEGSFQVLLPPATGRAILLELNGRSHGASDLSGNGSYATWQATLPEQPLGRQRFRATLYEDGEAVHALTRMFYTVPVSNLPPAISLVDPAEPLHGMRAIAYAASDPDGASDIVDVESRIDGGAWRAASDGAVLVDARVLVDGAHTLDVRVTDASGATAIATLAFVAEPWAVALAAPAVIEEGVATPATLFVNGTGVESAAPQLVLTGAFDAVLNPTCVSGVCEVALPPMPSGFVGVEIRQGADHLGQTTLLVDRAPSALILGPATATRLQDVTLQDASTDDSGIAARTWTLPDGSTSASPTLTVAAGALPVGEHEFALRVTNVNGLEQTATHRVIIWNHAPTVTVSPFRLGSDEVTRLFVGERVTFDVDFGDAEGDALEIAAGGLWIGDGTYGPIDPQGGTYTLLADRVGSVGVDVTIRDAWDATREIQGIGVWPNTRPVARLDAMTDAAAGALARFDGSASRDADRPYLEHRLEIEGLGAWDGPAHEIALPMGTWNATLTVRDSSGATDTARQTVVADDWLRLVGEMAARPTAREQGVLDLRAEWWDAAPVEGTVVRVEVWHASFPGAARVFDVTTDERGAAEVSLGFDARIVNLPGQHWIRATLHAPSQPGAPVDDEETASLLVGYVV